jgi:ABC-type lipoprotein export system ATPase subunit
MPGRSVPRTTAGLSGDLTPAESGITVVTNAAQRGSAVVIATHDEQILAVADEVVRLADGAVVDRDVA